MGKRCQPVEGRRKDRFRPPHCPWPDCPDHTVKRGYRTKPAGSYTLRGRRIPRFRCLRCRRTFSMRTFACTYYLKQPQLLGPVAAGLVAGCAHRQIARSLGCAASTVTRMAARIGRHCLLFQAAALDRLPPVDEPFVIDHFETFVFSQDDRLAIATPVGQRSWFVYAMDPAPHARAGPRSARKRKPRRPLPDKIPDPYVRSTRRVLGLLRSISAGPLELVSDDHPAYRAAVGSMPPGTVGRHRVYPNPRKTVPFSAEAAERNRAMFPVDLLHKLWRHTQRRHGRETLAFSRRANAALEAAATMIVWRNFIKGVSERKPDPTTPAMRLGLTREPLGWVDVFCQRLFPGRIELPEGWMKIYRREWITPAVGRNVPHDLVHAF